MGKKIKEQRKNRTTGLFEWNLQNEYLKRKQGQAMQFTDGQMYGQTIIACKIFILIELLEMD